MKGGKIGEKKFDSNLRLKEKANDRANIKEENKRIRTSSLYSLLTPLSSRRRTSFTLPLRAALISAFSSACEGMMVDAFLLLRVVHEEERPCRRADTLPRARAPSASAPEPRAVNMRRGMQRHSSYLAASGKRASAVRCQGKES